MKTLNHCEYIQTVKQFEKCYKDEQVNKNMIAFLNYFLNPIFESKTVKFYAFFAHDVNLALIFQFFEFNNLNCLLEIYENFVENPESFSGDCLLIKYAANLIFEVFEEGGEKFVDVFYNNKNIN